jgi:hypothetical protein
MTAPDSPRQLLTSLDESEADVEEAWALEIQQRAAEARQNPHEDEDWRIVSTRFSGKCCPVETCTPSIEGARDATLILAWSSHRVEGRGPAGVTVAIADYRLRR